MTLGDRARYRLLWLQSAGLVTWYRLLLRFDSRGVLLRARRRGEYGRVPRDTGDWRQLQLLGHAVTTAGARVADPDKPCLPIALAAHRLLVVRGWQALLCLGVLKNGQSIDAHAWVECAGRAIVGKPAPGTLPLRAPASTS